MSEVIYLSNVRLSFPHIATPQITKKDDGTEKASYNAEFIMAPNDPGFAKFWQVVNAMAVEKWKEHAQAVLQMVQTDRKKRCYGNGAEKINNKTMKVYEGYDGGVFITAGRDRMPQIIDAAGTPIDAANVMACQAEARKMYGGCYVNAAVKPWLQDNKFGKGVRCDFIAIQFARDGEPFGEGAIDVSGMFGAAAAAPAAAAPWAPQPAMPAPPFAQPAAPATPSWM